ncbi:hypothetical protein HELRODRAFT_168056 [Helobdella robusta]|uniref:Sushi domain-containing protein n=1 Tax=Helobdella robusta TaxID=6412 RepID=T1F044_HELRO|nr:hypothetical protein HELRODRAFT_168056 [Helobdella robusta]ESO10184.1 hypothetical protein HELRODRAFT_168056 [Helobdella robusta]
MESKKIKRDCGGLNQKTKKVFGCSYSLLPSLATISNHGSDVSISCNDSYEIYYVTCVENQWKGEIGNCSNNAQKIRLPSMISQPGNDYKHGQCFFCNFITCSLIICLLFKLVNTGHSLFVT